MNTTAVAAKCALQTMGVTAEEVGFAGAAQIGKLRSRVRGCDRRACLPAGR